MKGSMKMWLIIAGALMIVGLVIFAVVMTINGWDFSKLGTGKYVTNTHAISEPFRNIDIKTDTADVKLLPSEDGTCKVVCYELEKEKHTVAAADGVLSICVTDERAWYEYIGVNFAAPKITVYLPETAYAALSIDASTGDVDIPGDFKFESMDISLSTGDVKNEASVEEQMKITTSTGDISVAKATAGEALLSVSTGGITVRSVECTGVVNVRVSTGTAKLADLRCKTFNSDGSTGSITLTNTIASEKCTIQRSTGDVTLNGCDAGELYLKTSTGDVEGSLLSEKVFFAETSTGDVSVPKTITGGRCEITTSTGDIRMQVAS